MYKKNNELKCIWPSDSSQMIYILHGFFCHSDRMQTQIKINNRVHLKIIQCCTECPKIYRKSVLHLHSTPQIDTYTDAVQIRDKVWDNQIYL